MVDEVVVVLGVGGMGEAIARRQGAGKKLLLADYNVETLQKAADCLAGDGFEVHTHVVDVSSRSSVDELVTFGHDLGPVVNVAHTAGLSPVQASAEAILAVDLMGVGNVLDAFGETIAPGGAGVVIASMEGSMTADALPVDIANALRGTPTSELSSLPIWSSPAFADSGRACSLAKRGNQLQVQAASVAWGQRGARINSISPGVISTSMGQQELRSESGRGMRAMINASGAKRIGTTTDIADAAAFLLGPHSSFITGSDLLVDGGVVAAVRSGALAMTPDRAADKD